MTTYDYDNAGQLTSTDYSDTTPDVAITYDRLGRQKTVTDVTGERTFTYDPATLRLKSETLPSAYYGDRILTRTYQVAASTSEPTSVPGRSAGFELGTTATPDADTAVSYTYDTAGRLSTVTDSSSLYTYAYMPNSNLRHTLTSPVHVATTTYEDYRDVIDIMENKVGSTSISKYAYTVNSLGQRTQRVNTGTAFGATSTDNFTYNAKGEVTASTNATIPAYDRTFAYDDIGNRKSSSAGILPAVSYSANGLNQYTAIGAASPTHDLDGNQLTTGTGHIYKWDAENRLISVEPALPLTSDKKQVNTYDGQSRRVRKQVYTYTGSAWSPTTDEKFIYDGWNVVAVLNAASSNELLRTYTWGMDLSGSLQGAGGVGGLLATSEISGGTISATYHYTYDANGNVSEVLNSSGGIAAHYEYDAFGNTVASSGTYASTNLYRFSTKPLDSVSELYYYGFRYYNPSTGRWPSRDPIQELGGFNLYGMVENDPVNFFDISGLYKSSMQSPTGAAVMADLAGTGATAGVSVGATVVVNAAIVNTIIQPGQKPKDVLTKAELEEYVRERGNYKSQCGQSMPPGLDLCKRLEWLIAHKKNCLKLREEFGKKWHNDNDPAHNKTNDDLRRGITNDERTYKLNCTPCPPPTPTPPPAAP
ncbi:MAG: RHS repeat-associated core domain-containing protein [Verrucomicrobiota bacterium]